MKIFPLNALTFRYSAQKISETMNLEENSIVMNLKESTEDLKAGYFSIRYLVHCCDKISISLTSTANQCITLWGVLVDFYG